MLSLHHRNYWSLFHSDNHSALQKWKSKREESKTWLKRKELRSWAGVWIIWGENMQVCHLHILDIKLRSNWTWFLIHFKFFNFKNFILIFYWPSYACSVNSVCVCVYVCVLGWWWWSALGQGQAVDWALQSTDRIVLETNFNWHLYFGIYLERGSGLGKVGMYYPQP